MGDEDGEKNGNDKNTYIFLDFNGKLSSDVFKKEVFFRIANLHKKNPLIQVNDSLFKGTFDLAMGTNLYFEKLDDNPNISNNAFEKQAPIQLKFIEKSTKIISLQQVKIPQNKAKIQNEIKNINYDLNWDYNTLLEKFEDGSLQINDIGTDEVLHQKMEVQEEVDDSNFDQQTDETQKIPEPEPEIQSEQDKKLDVVLENMSVKLLEAEYEELNFLARKPMKRAISPELIKECDKKYEEAYEYHNIECQVLKPRDGLKSEVIPVEEDTLHDCIDISRCVLYGIIPPSSQYPRILANEEKQKLLTLENFDNLSLAARYYVLHNLIHDLEESVNLASKEKLETKDEHGHMPVQTLNIFKRLSEALKRRLQDIKFSFESENNKETKSSK